MLKKKWNQKSLPIALTLMALLPLIGTGCGQKAYNEDEETELDGSDGGYQWPDSGAGNGTGGNGGNVVVNNQQTNSNSPPSHSYEFKVKGTGAATVVGGGSMTVNADALLKISIQAGDKMGINGAPGYTYLGYNCQKFTIKVNQITKVAFVKRADYYHNYSYNSQDPCAGASTTWTGDFSAALGQNPTNYTVQISNAMYDNCRYFNNGYYTVVDPTSGSCAMSSVYSASGSYYHTMNGYIDIYTD